MIPIDIVLQGPLHSYTAKIADHYTKLPFVNCVIISCWETCPDINSSMLNWENPRIFVLKNKDPEFPGDWNRNRMIKSSFEGINSSVSDYVIKMRSDQIVSYNSMMMLYEYYFKRKDIDLKFLGDTKLPHSRIGIMGICRDFPYHPIDHIFWGHREDLLNLFGIEHDLSNMKDKNLSEPFEYGDVFVRSEVYLTAPYVAKFSEDAANHVKNPDVYLKDKSEKRSEALETSKKFMDRVFMVFPKIEMQWPKNGMAQYHYDVMATERGGHAYWAE